MTENNLLSILNNKLGFVAKSLDAMTVFYETPHYVLSETIDGWELRLNKEYDGETIMIGSLEMVVKFLSGDLFVAIA